MGDKLDCCHQLRRAQLPHGADGLCVGVGTTYSAVCRRNLKKKRVRDRDRARRQGHRKRGKKEEKNTRTKGNGEENLLEEMKHEK